MAIYKLKIMVAKSTSGSAMTSTLICFKDKNTIKAAYQEAVDLCNEVFPPNGTPLASYITAEEVPA